VVLTLEGFGEVGGDESGPSGDEAAHGFIECTVRVRGGR
jgi:hypothetical protein